MEMTAYDAEGMRFAHSFWDRVLIWTCLVFYLLIDICFVFVAAFNIDESFPNPVLHAWFHGVFWSGWVLLCIWGLIESYRETFVLSPSKIIHRRVITSTSVSLADVRSITWQLPPKRLAIVVRDDTQKLRIDLSNFSLADRLRIIEYVREACPESVHEGWAEFDAWVAKRLKQKPIPSVSSAISCAVLFFVCAIPFLYCGSLGWGTGFIPIGVANLLAGAWYVWRIVSHCSRKPEVAAEESPTKPEASVGPA
jgi:hypothetical protein